MENLTELKVFCVIAGERRRLLACHVVSIPILLNQSRNLKAVLLKRLEL
jgi:hypothetical protein